jgi:hypothetical protein
MNGLFRDDNPGPTSTHPEGTDYERTFSRRQVTTTPGQFPGFWGRETDSGMDFFATTK